jgi:hypothetical protein
MKNPNKTVTIGLGMVMAAGLLFVLGAGNGSTQNSHQGNERKPSSFDAQIRTNAQQMIDEGRQSFRFDTFGDEAFWGGRLKLHQAIAGATFAVSIRGCGQPLRSKKRRSSGVPDKIASGALTAGPLHRSDKDGQIQKRHNYSNFTG